MKILLGSIKSDGFGMRLVQTSDSDELEAKPSVLRSSPPDGLNFCYVCCAYRYVHTVLLILIIVHLF